MTSPLVGRDAELAAVTERVAAAGDGAGGVLVVLGEAGVGKSRLLAEAARLATGAGLAVLTPYRAALGRLLPSWTGTADLPEPAVDPGVVLGEGVLRLLGHLAPAGCLLVLDDLHWADPDTLALVDYLA